MDQQPTQQPAPEQPAQQRSPWVQQVVGHMLDNLKSNYENPGVLAAQDQAYWAKAIKPTRRAQVPPKPNPDGSLVNEQGT